MPKKKDKVVQKVLDKIPGYLVAGQGEDTGTDGMDSNDTPSPRMKICQPTSSEIKDTIDIKDGEFYNTLTNENCGNSIELFILLFWRSKVWFTEDFKLRCTSYKDLATGKQVVIGNEQEECLKDCNYPYKKDTAEDGFKDSHNYMVLLKKDLIDHTNIPLPTIFSVMSSAMKYSKQLNGRIQLNSIRRIPIYAQLVKAETFLQKFKKGSAYMPKFSYPDFATKQEFEILKVMRDTAVKIHNAGNALNDNEAPY